MLHIGLLQRAFHFPRRLVREGLRVFQLIRYQLINRLGSSKVTQTGGPVVSLTTVGKRSAIVYLAIESIARGSVRPSRLILWIDDKELFRNLPGAIRRLQRRGLEVKLCNNYGPHTKYYPYLESKFAFDAPLVTADDDILYPRYWLKKLIEANRECPGAVNCYWARVIELDSGGVKEYSSLKRCSSTRLSFRHIALGVMGVIYSPSFLAVVKCAGTGFQSCCPRQDDLWLHVQALRAGYRVRQIFPQLPYFSFHGIPGSQQTALSYENVTHGDGCDQQIRATYTQADIQLLRNDYGVASR
jgi:hypothetical protein